MTGILHTKASSFTVCSLKLQFLGLAYKRKVGGSHEKLKEEFPGLEQQIQLNDVMENEKIQEFFRQHFRAFLHYLEDTEPALTNHTGYMKKMHKHILKGNVCFIKIRTTHKM